MGKTSSVQLPPNRYRDEPDRDDTASTSSAVPLQGVNVHTDDFPDAELPAYEDVPRLPSRPGALVQSEREQPSYFNFPPLPYSSTSRDQKTTTTQYPLYSQDADQLKQMLQTQAKIPPTWTCRLTGTHKETTHKQDNKTETKTITDFDIHLDMTHLLVPTPTTPPRLLTPDFTLPDPFTKTYRGNRLKEPQHPSSSSSPPTDPESPPNIDTYIHAYTTSPHPVRTFTLTRTIIHHDTTALTTHLTSLINATNYRGHLQITYPTTHTHLTVLSPCWQNRLRSNPYIRWFFYLTFLWLFSWPYLLLATRRWAVLTKQFAYSCCVDNCGNRQFVAGKSEEAFFHEWRESLRRAALGRLQGWVDEKYRLQTEILDQSAARGAERTGNAAVDGAVGLLQQAAQWSRDGAVRGGWGADS